MRLLMHQFFIGAESFHDRGVVLNLGDAPILVYATFTNHLGDYPALSSSYSTKGHNAINPCSVLCANVVCKGALGGKVPISNPTGVLVEISCMEPNKFVLMSDNDVWAKVDLLRAKKGKIAVGKFLNLERSLGFNDNPFGLLQEIDLRGIVSPTGSFTLDWVHIYLNNGIGGSELWCVLERLDLIDVKYDTFAEECLRWRWPGKIEEKGYTGASAAAVFSTKRAESNKHGWKSSASEFLMVYPMVLHWLQANVAKHMPEEVECFRRLASVIDKIQALKYGVATNTRSLHLSIVSHQELHFPFI